MDSVPEDVCSICLNKLDDTGLLVFPCKHTFHRHCCSEWMKHKLSPQVNAGLLKVYSPAVNSGAVRTPGTTNFVVGRYFDLLEQCPMCRELGSWLYFDYDPDEHNSPQADLDSLEGIITLKKIRCLICFADELVIPITDIDSVYGLNLYYSHPTLSPFFNSMFEFSRKSILNGCKTIHMYGPAGGTSGFFMAPDPIITETETVESPFNRARHLHPTEFYTLAHTLFPQFYTKITPEKK